MIFLTYNDSFSGIYKSQVIDVCAFMERELGTKTKLVAFISIRNFFAQRKLIKSAYRSSVVLPMFPKAQFWELNTFTLFWTQLFLSHKKIWARGPFACSMALSLKRIGMFKEVVFDARGAYQAELTEYNVVENESIKRSIGSIEENALKKSTAQLAVSLKLREWWKSKYNFVPSKSEVIPCTLSENFQAPFPPEERIKQLRSKLGFSEKDIVLVYSGSSAGWQSFKLVDGFLHPLLASNPDIKILFLSNEVPVNASVFMNFPDRVVTKWVTPHEVRDILLTADHGLLIREKSVTNEVASPVKFAEYLSCGLEVIISEGIGDFTEFVQQNNCGQLNGKTISPQKIPYSKKEANHRLALQYFSKNSAAITKAYSHLLAD